MNIAKLLKKNNEDFWNVKKPTIAFLGDSVTQGCFDLHKTANGGFDTYFEQEYAYHRYIAKILGILFPKVPVNIINAGLSGGNVVHALVRLERDVLCYNPDLTVVCFGLNDCGGGMNEIDKYYNCLIEIFEKLKNAGSEVIFMTPNMMNTEISGKMDKQFTELAEGAMKNQLDGILEAYLEKAKEAARLCDVKVCDVYAKWKCLYENGVNITDLLANKINHPTHEMNWMFAYELVNTMFE